MEQPKKQTVPTTVERDFEVENRKWQKLKEQIRKLQKDMKKRPDADLAMSMLDLPCNPVREQNQNF